MSSLSEIINDINQTDIAINTTRTWLETYPALVKQHQVLQEQLSVLHEARKQLIHDLKLIVQ